jgi:tetratricopeptide (TPR) repeat protein
MTWRSRWEGLASAEEAGDRPLASELRAVLGRLAYYRGDLSAAHEAYQEAVAVQRGLGADRLVAINVARLADVEVHLGQLDAAEEHYRESLLMVTEAGNDVIAAVMLVFLAWVASRKASYQRAARLIGAVERTREEIKGGPTREASPEWVDAEHEARRALGDEAFERARAQGFTLTLEEAISYAARAIWLTSKEAMDVATFEPNRGAGHEGRGVVPVARRCVSACSRWYLRIWPSSGGSPGDTRSSQSANRSCKRARSSRVML